MESWLRLIAEKATSIENIPHRIRGKVIHGDDDSPRVLSARSKLSLSPPYVDVYVGQDPHSCTSTAAAIAWWLSPRQTDRPLYLSELSHAHPRVNLSTLNTDVAVASFMSPIASSTSDTMHLMVFHTPHHKFTVLCSGGALDGRGVLLHSNQDDTRGGCRFTLADWLSKAPRPKSYAQLAHMIHELALSATGIADHEAVFQTLFGSRFKKGNIDDYWVLLIALEAPPHDDPLLQHG